MVVLNHFLKSPLVEGGGEWTEDLTFIFHTAPTLKIKLQETQIAPQREISLPFQSLIDL